MSDDDIHSCGPTCSREACVKARRDAHRYFAMHGSRDAVLAVLGGLQRGKHTVEEAAEVLWALMDARVGSVTHDLANVMRAMRDGRSTIHWRADETAATALIRERDQLAAKVEKLHARLRQSTERTARMLLGELVRAIDSGEDTASTLWIARDYLGRKQPDVAT